MFYVLLHLVVVLHQMILKATKYYNQHPLRVILFVGLFFRLLAALFSRGYAFTDDHFFVIEEAFQWLQSGDFFNPHTFDPQRLAHGTLYTFVHYCFLYLTDGIPTNLQMFFVRLFHAGYSLLLVKWVFQWIKNTYDLKLACQSAWLVSIFFLFPYLSVRNLVEFISIPPLFWGMWKLNSTEIQRPITLFLVGLSFSIAFGLRMQTILVSGTAGLIYLFTQPVRKSFTVFFGFLIGFVIINIGLDYWIWGQPLHELIEYVSYNSNNSHLYPNGPWYQYIPLLIGIGLLPFGPLIFYGYLKSLKINWKWTVPILVFIVFHSIYPNKQERFIFTILPFYLVLGWIEFTHSSGKVLQKFKSKKWQYLFWTTNTLLLILLVFTSTKTGKMDVMLELRNYGEANKIVVENSQREGREYFPLFYWGKLGKVDHITTKLSTQNYYDSVRILNRKPPEFVVFLDTNNWSYRKENFLRFGIILEDSLRIYDSWIDNIVSELNPRVRKNVWTIFHLNYAQCNPGFLPASAGSTTIKTTSASKAAKTTATIKTTPATVPSTKTSKK